MLSQAETRLNSRAFPGTVRFFARSTGYERSFERSVVAMQL
jgi:hypothetical protein